MEKLIKNNITNKKAFTLVELLVAMAATAVVIGFLYASFMTQQVTYSAEQQIINLQQNMRIALDIISRDIRMGGYWGCASPKPGRFKNTLNATQLVIAPTSGADNITTSNDPFGDGTEIKEYTDIVGVSYSDPEFDAPVLTAFSPSANVKLVPTADAQSIVEGDILVISDCEHTAVFQATNVNPSGSKVEVVHNTGTSNPAPGNITKCLKCDDPDNNTCISSSNCNDAGVEFDETANVYRLTSKHYFLTPDNQLRVAKGGYTGSSSSFEFNNDEDIIAENIEDLQLLYGEDTDGDGYPDVWNGAGGVGDWGNVSTVEIHLLGRTARKSKDYKDHNVYTLPDRTHGPFTSEEDNYRRLYMTRTVVLRNAL